MRNEKPVLLVPNLNVYTPILQREYLIATRAVTISSSQETRNSYSVVNLLRTQTAIQRILSLYLFYRFSAIKIRVLVRSLPQQYGFAWVTRCAFFDTMQTNHSADDLWISKDPLVLTLNDQKGGEFELPNLSMQAWFLTQTSSHNDGNDIMWAVHMGNDATYKTDSSVSGTYELYMFASFVNPEVAGPIDPNYVAPREPKIVGQSDKGYATWVRAAAGAAFLAFSATRNANIPQTAKSETPEMKQVQSKQMGIVQSHYGESSLPTLEGAGCNLDFVPDDDTVSPGLYGDSESEHEICRMIRRPQYEGTFALSSSSEDLYLPMLPNTQLIQGTFLESVGYLSWFSQFFRRWRGSIKVLLSFTTSSFISARLFISMFWGGLITPGDIGDFHTDVVTIKGNVTHTLIFPWIRAQQWALTTDDVDVDISPTILIHLDSISSTGSVTPIVVTQVWYAAGDDFVYDSPQLAYNPSLMETLNGKEKEKEEKIRGQTDVTALFATTSFDSISGFSAPPRAEDAIRVEDILKRWSTRGSTIAASDARVHSWTSGSSYDATVIGNWDFLCNMFLYNSGAVRRKIFYTVSPVSGSVYQRGWLSMTTLNAAHYSYEGVENGVFGTLTNLNPVMDITCPFIAEYLVDLNPEWAYTNNDSSTEFAFNLSGTGATVLNSWVKMGNNFRLHHLQPLPGISKWPWSYNLGFKGKRNS